jgi:hypothetical protein
VTSDDFYNIMTHRVYWKEPKEGKWSFAYAFIVHWLTQTYFN